jgi:predicted aspartyl protease
MEKKNISNEEGLHPESDLRTVRVHWREVGRTARSTSGALVGKTLIGEVRVKVTLTNAVDEALVRRGLLSADKIRRYEADALVDTGAVRSVLPIHIVQRLGLVTVRRTRATYANDVTEDIDVTEMVGIDLIGRRTTEETLVLGSEVLIGQTVLESLDLLVDCVNLRVIPNPAHPDQPVIKIKATGIREAEALRAY